MSFCRRSSQQISWLSTEDTRLVGWGFNDVFSTIQVILRIFLMVELYYKNKLAPYGTDGQLLLTANFKIT